VDTSIVLFTYWDLMFWCGYFFVDSDKGGVRHVFLQVWA